MSEYDQKEKSKKKVEVEDRKILIKMMGSIKEGAQYKIKHKEL